MSDWAAITLQVATELLGEPNQRLSSQDELRWGTRGSFALKRSTGRWRDFEAGESGGAIQLVQRERSCDKTAALQWLRDRRLMPAEPAQLRRHLWVQQGTFTPSEREHESINPAPLVPQDA